MKPSWIRTPPSQVYGWVTSGLRPSRKKGETRLAFINPIYPSCGRHCETAALNSYGRLFFPSEVARRLENARCLVFWTWQENWRWWNPNAPGRHSFQPSTKYTQTRLLSLSPSSVLDAFFPLFIQDCGAFVSVSLLFLAGHWVCLRCIAHRPDLSRMFPAIMHASKTCPGARWTEQIACQGGFASGRVHQPTLRRAAGQAQGVSSRYATPGSVCIYVRADGREREAMIYLSSFLPGPSVS